jgi:hypothetical protein
LWRENNPGQGLLKSFFISSLAGGVGSTAEELVVDVAKIIGSNMNVANMNIGILDRMNVLQKIDKVLGVFAGVGTALAYPTSNSGPLMELGMPWLNSLEPYLGVLWESPSSPDNCQCQCDTTEEPTSEPAFDSPSSENDVQPSIHYNYEPESPYCSF